MSGVITVRRNDDAEQVELTATTTGLDVFGDNRAVVAMRVNGESRDLQRELVDGDFVEPILIDSDEGIGIVRHSAAHVTAQALQNLFVDAKLGIGPPITDGFYYDFQTGALTPEDLKAIEKRMGQIVKERQRFVRRVVTDDEARVELADEPFKLELIADKGSASADDGSSVEVGAGDLTIYDNVRRDGSVAWKDLCRGPHVPNTGYLGNGWALTRTSAAYWRGDQSKADLQRVYGTAWPTKEELQAYRTRLEEAAKRDHRKLGTELDLFSFNELVGSGLPLIHPKGGVLKREMEDYVRTRHIEEGFDYVGTPHIAKEELFYTSGHLPYYADGMFPPLLEDAVRDEQGNVVKGGQAYRLKAMNCPMHNLIFSSRGRSYRELPLRFFEFGTVYRDEKSGVVQGLTRVRSITQDDSHSYVMKEQAPDEVRHLLRFILSLLNDFGLTDVALEVSTRDEDGKKRDKFIGSDQQWEEGTAILQQIADESGLTVVPDPGGAAYYGPKISIQAKDAIGRVWQMSTIQYDFNQPERFGLEYTAPDGSRQQPVMIHSAKFGSIERFMGVLIEHYAGAFPAWLAPVQVTAVPVAAEFDGYLQGIVDQLRARGIRVEFDESDDRFAKKIRNASKHKAPFVLIAGGDDRDAGSVSFRFRDGSQRNGVPAAQAVEDIVAFVASRSNESPSADA
ncbi:threonyl-tRNA synthetase [Tessaracoccus bendigoensis DSM 12906]|uniref:Threonine--tRNA ligase n=1 Tax=Tessaracoccus bendigoensis DSM 12906 TaxID=1123357 RepID=A0A1M6KJM8_9ACTN|nr:threonine--tRNA ligase [Tessaracoccus bendigoensis]SHJ59163.1 threonyl-tRNA synthetase [Tessaracoccus bendigoensis DSM 12906]